MSKVDQWMPLYIAEYTADTTRFTCEQHGAYLLIIMDYWRNGPPPDDDVVLAQVAKLPPARWKALRPILAPKFQIGGGVWKHKRVEKELMKARGMSESKSAAGRDGAEAKWGDISNHKMKRSERLAVARAIATHTQEEWIALVNICSGRCCSCEKAGDVVKDHITPIYKGGSDGIENLQPLCKGCNSAKGPDSSDLRPVDWLERLAKCLAERLPERLAERLTNACVTPAPSPSSLPSSLPTSVPSSGPSPSPQPEAKNKARKRAAIRPEGVSEKVWDDFKALRSAKSAPLTDTALEGIEREAKKAGMPLQAALEIACRRGWQGFEGAWLNGSKPHSNADAAAEAKRRIFGEERDVTDESERL